MVDLGVELSLDHVEITFAVSEYTIAYLISFYPLNINIDENTNKSQEIIS